MSDNTHEAYLLISKRNLSALAMFSISEAYSDNIKDSSAVGTNLSSWKKKEKKTGLSIKSYAQWGIKFHYPLPFYVSSNQIFHAMFLQVYSHGYVTREGNMSKDLELHTFAPSP